MIDVTILRESPDLVRDALRRRGEATEIVDAVRAVDEAYRALLNKLEALRAGRNAASKAIARMDDTAERQVAIEASQRLRTQVEKLDAEVSGHAKSLNALLEQLPNIPRADVPLGNGETDNIVIRQVGDLPIDEGFIRRAHWDLGPAQSLIDFERGVRISGSRFYILYGEAARLQRALIQFMLDFHTARGYQEVDTPFVVREQCLWNAGQLPKFRDNLYHDVEDDVWLVPTAEVPLTNLYAGEILTGDQLPIHHVAYTPCFRREKMSAGRDVRGIKRGHQFNKVEMYKFTRPEDSAAELDRMLADGEAILQALGLPYRVLQLCTGDLGFGSMITYDLEVFAAGCDEWLEVSSISDFGSFQARRAGIRFRREPGAPTEFVHTLNGSGLGLPRTMIAILENGQQADGRIRVPEVLRDRMGTNFVGGSRS